MPSPPSIRMPKASLYTTTNSAFSATNSLQGQLMQANLLCQDRLEATARQYRLRQDRQQASTPTKTTTKQPSSVQIAASFRDPQWKHVRSRSDIRVFRHAQRNNGVSTMMATGLLHGSLHDVMDGLYAESSKELRVLHTLLSDRILDSAMLFVDEVRSQAETYRFAGVQWMVIKAPNTIGLCKDRDFCCYKQTGVFTDEHGNDVGFLVLQSMESVDQCALTSKMDANGYIRGHISIACQFRPLKDDLVEVFMHGDVDAKGKLPSRLAEAAFAETFLSIANAFESGEAKKLSLLLSSPVEQRVPGGVHAAILAKKLNDRCDLCTATATFWNPHDYCRGCYHRVCRRCRVDKPIFCAHYHRSHAATQRRRPCTETFCLECVCSVVDSSIQMNAKLMRQQQKRREHSQRSLRRERTGTASTEGSLFNVSSSASSYTETPEKSEYRRLINDHSSVVSVFSSTESDKHRQHRLNVRTSRRPRVPKTVSIRKPTAGSTSSTSSTKARSSSTSEDMRTFDESASAFQVSQQRHKSSSECPELSPVRRSSRRRRRRQDARNGTWTPVRSDEYYSRLLERALRQRSNASTKSLNLSELDTQSSLTTSTASS